LDRINTVLNVISQGMHRIGTLIFIPLMAGIITLDVILRYLFKSPLLWSHEVNGLLLLTFFFLSIIYCWDKDRHVRMEIFYNRFGSGMKRVSDIATGIVGAAFFGALAVQCVLDIPYMIRTNESGDQLGVQLWPLKAIIASVSVVFFLKFLVFIFSRFKTSKEI
jgi:TRAP-type C4-dicarboxylate transport system permease small subunit